MYVHVHVYAVCICMTVYVICIHYMYIMQGIVCVCSCQLNKCLSDNQKLWKGRVSMLEDKFSVATTQKEQVVLIPQLKREHYRAMYGGVMSVSDATYIGSE